MLQKELKQYFSVQDRNKKLKPTKNVKFAIWSITAIETCPQRTKGCEQLCYVLKAYKQYPNCKPCHDKNYKFSQSDNFVPYMINYFENRLKSIHRNNQTLLVRVHESGDFYSVEYINKWYEIVKHFENDESIKFYAYTKSINLMLASKFFKIGHGFEFLPNFKINFSVWSDTDAFSLHIIKKYNLPTYTADTAENLKTEKYKGFARCNCVSCGTCAMCANRKVKNIVCEIH